jgi:Zn-dependent protease
MYGSMGNMPFQNVVILVITTVLAVMVCMVIHELCHGFAAYALGDPTAKRMGRLTLNPVRHIDPIGGLMLLFVGFGWAKPVQVDPRYFDKPKRDMALVALAGPFSNFILAFLTMGLWVNTYVWALRGGTPGYILSSFLESLIILNLGLGIFNLLPIPPLDGSKVLATFLPDRFYWRWMQVERYGMFILLFLMITGSLSGFLNNFINGLFNLMVGVWT